MDDFNKAVTSALSGKRKTLSRPFRNVRYKTEVQFMCKNCCNVAFNNDSQLNMHMKTSHSSKVSQVRSSEARIPVIDNLSLKDLSADEDSRQSLELEEKCQIITNTDQTSTEDRNSLECHSRIHCSSFTIDEDLRKHLLQLSKVSQTPQPVSDPIFWS